MLHMCSHVRLILCRAALPLGKGDEFALVSETLAKVSTPTHFIWGTDDGFGGQDVAEWTVAVIPNATVEMKPNSGHLPWLDDPRGVAHATTSFLASTGPDPAAIHQLDPRSDPGSRSRPGIGSRHPGSPQGWTLCL